MDHLKELEKLIKYTWDEGFPENKRLTEVKFDDSDFFIRHKKTLANDHVTPIYPTLPEAITELSVAQTIYSSYISCQSKNQNIDGEPNSVISIRYQKDNTRYIMALPGINFTS